MLIEEIEQVPQTYLKHLEGIDGLYEIRVQLANDIFTIFCFFDEESLVVLANEFQNKTHKTPYGYLLYSFYRNPLCKDSNHPVILPKELTAIMLSVALDQYQNKG